MIATLPCSVSNSVSRINVPFLYRRVTRIAKVVGANFHAHVRGCPKWLRNRPLSRSVANTATQWTRPLRLRQQFRNLRSMHNLQSGKACIYLKRTSCQRAVSIASMETSLFSRGHRERCRRIMSFPFLAPIRTSSAAEFWSATSIDFPINLVSASSITWESDRQPRIRPIRFESVLD